MENVLIWSWLCTTYYNYIITFKLQLIFVSLVSVNFYTSGQRGETIFNFYMIFDLNGFCCYYH